MYVKRVVVVEWICLLYSRVCVLFVSLHRWQEKHLLYTEEKELSTIDLILANIFSGVVLCLYCTYILTDDEGRYHHTNKIQERQKKKKSSLDDRTIRTTSLFSLWLLNIYLLILVISSVAYFILFVALLFIESY
jgi:uncharacterized ion transporter superfamily protein YfcC